MPAKAAEIVERLASTRRVIVLGGIAVIAHGLSRVTEDSDIWLDPGSSLAAWCDQVRAILPVDSGLFDVSRRDSIFPSQLEDTIDLAGMVRVTGLDRYLDIFYQPNQLDLEDFDAAWEQSRLALGEARVMDESFLIATKTNTGRKSDQDDISFLEKKLREEICAALATCTEPEARDLFSRYLDHATAEAATRNPSPAVRSLGFDGLRELAEGGNPFAIAALKRLDSPT